MDVEARDALTRAKPHSMLHEPFRRMGEQLLMSAPAQQEFLAERRPVVGAGVFLTDKEQLAVGIEPADFLGRMAGGHAASDQ
jgi:hypothetical protein